MGRVVFIIWLLFAIAIAGGTTYAALRFIVEIGTVARPLGINGTVLQNSLIIAAVGLGYLILTWASIRRLRAVDAWPGWIAIGLLPVLAIVLFNGPLFLTRKIPMPAWIEDGVLVLAAFLIVYGLARAIFSARREVRLGGSFQRGG
ncbi:MAG: hypothetical protein AAFR70_08045 [Pseudomonadota bacterium]